LHPADSAAASAAAGHIIRQFSLFVTGYSPWIELSVYCHLIGRAGAQPRSRFSDADAVERSTNDEKKDETAKSGAAGRPKPRQ
jgi:hypothetical protein